MLSLVSYAQSTTGPIAHWDFNSTTNDITGNGHHGTGYNITYTTDKYGRQGKAAVFNGTSSYAVVSDHSDFDITNYSITAKVKYNGFYTNNCQANVILMRGEVATPGRYSMYTFDNAYNSCTAYDTNKYVLTTQSGSNDVTPISKWQNNVKIHTGQWYDLAVTYDGTNYKMYVNGTLTNTVYFPSGSVGNGNLPIGIGKNITSTGNTYPYWLNGVLDDLRLFDHALDDTDITALTYDHWIDQPFTDTIFCVGDTFTVYYSTNKAYKTGNTFTVQLSNASGSFANPVSIGSTTATNSGSIFCTIPSNTTSGNGYRIRIASTAPAKFSDANEIDISIGNLPNISASNNGPICSGNSILLSTSPTNNNITYSWTGPNNFSSGTQNPSRANATVADGGNYIVTATMGSCSDTDTTVVVVNATPAKPQAGSNTPVCPNTTLNLTASHSSSLVNYSWTGPNSFSSNTQNPTLNSATYTMAGDYIVTVSQNGCTSEPDTTSVVVTITTPTPQASSNAPICSGQYLFLYANNITNATYSWRGPNGYTSSLQNPSIANSTMSNAGTYFVKATVNGCESLEDSVIVTINQGPTFNIYASPGSEICDGETVTFVSITNNTGSTPTYQWQKNGTNVSGANGITYTTNNLASGDIVNCVMGNMASCPNTFDTSNKVTMIIRQHVTPTVSITSNPVPPVVPFQLVTFTANSTNAGNNPSYQWMRNGQPVVGATNSTWGTYQLSDGDSIYTILYSSDRCAAPDTAMSNVIRVEVLVSVDDIALLDNITLFPNPNNGSFTIKGSVNSDEEIAINIINAIGQIVYKGTAQPTGKRLEHNINIGSELAAGTYIIRLRSGEATTALRFTITQ